MMFDHAALDARKIALTTERSEYLTYDLKYNGHSMMDQLVEGQKALYDGDYQLLGQMMGEIYKLASVPVASESDAPIESKKVDFSNLAEMIQGFLGRLGVEVDFLGLLVCIYEADQSALMLYEDIEMAEEAWKDKDLMEGVFVALLTLAFVQSLEQQVEPACANLFGDFDWSPYAKMAAELLAPKPYHSYAGSNMQGHFVTATELYTAQNWFDYGSEVGATLAELDLPVSRINILY